MKKNFKILSLLLLSTVLFSCGSIPRMMGPYIEAGTQNTSNQPQAQQQQTTQQTQQTQNQAQTQPQQQQQISQQNYVTREEVFSMVSISDAPRLKVYNIVIGSFSVQENAQRLTKSLQPDYHPIIVINEKGMFRVIIASFDSYNVARDELVNSIKYKFPDAWILTQRR